MRGDPVAVIEAAYAVDRPVDPWLDGVLESLAPCLDDGLGVWAATFDGSKPNAFEFGAMRARGFSDGHLEMLKMGASTVSFDMVQKSFGAHVCGTLSEALGREFLATHPIAQAVKEQWGVGDGLGISAVDPTLRGCVLGISLKAPRKATPAFKQRWSRIAAHVAAGHRLRLQLEARSEALLDGAEAVLAPDGAVKHATGDAKEKASRAALRGAAVALDKARTRRRTAQPDEAIESWKGLVSGRWSLVDHFERDGRRYLVARRNDAQVEGPHLSLRELQVLGYAALGHSNKLIGYEMGLSTTTVATHLMHTARKLKVRSRAALIRAFQTNGGARPPA